MTIDIEVTLNRFGFERVAPNKVQIAFLRIAWWQIATKHSMGIEVNWRRDFSK